MVYRRDLSATIFAAVIIGFSFVGKIEATCLEMWAAKIDVVPLSEAYRKLSEPEVAILQESVAAVMAKNMHNNNWRPDYVNKNGKNAKNFKPVDPAELEGPPSAETLGYLKAKYPRGEFQLGLNKKTQLPEIQQNINTDAENIIPSLNMKLNGALAKDYANAIGQFIRDDRPLNDQGLHYLGNQIHVIWMKHNDWERASKPDLFRDYAALPIEEQVKDIRMATGTLEAYAAQLSP